MGPITPGANFTKCEEEKEVKNRIRKKRFIILGSNDTRGKYSKSKEEEKEYKRKK